jgi:periplasmic copper chaperone A
VSLRPPRPATAAVAVALGLALTGCGANFEAQTYQTRAVGDGTNAAVGAIAVRNVTLVAPESGDSYAEGDDAEVLLTLTNDGPDDDRLVEASSPDAEEVEVQQDGSASSGGVELPRLSTTANGVSLQLTGLSRDLRPGQYVEITLRFETNGEVTVSAPVATTGEYDEERERSEYFHEIGEEH